MVTGRDFDISETMTSISCISSSVRAACQHTSACFPLKRGITWPSSVGRCTNVLYGKHAVVQPCVTGVTGVRAVHGTQVNAAVVQQVRAAPLSSQLPLSGKSEDGLSLYLVGRCMTSKTAARPTPQLTPYISYTGPRSKAAALANIRSLLEGGVISKLCSKLADLPINDRAEGLATLLGLCAELDVEAHNPLVSRLISECLELLSNRGIGLAQLCHLGEVTYALEGRQSAMLTEVLNSIGTAVGEGRVSPSGAARVYSLLALCHQPAHQQQTLMLSTLHTHTHRLVHRLKASQVSDILQALLTLQQRQVGSCHFPACNGQDVCKKNSKRSHVGILYITLLLIFCFTGHFPAAEAESPSIACLQSFQRR